MMKILKGKTAFPGEAKGRACKNIKELKEGDILILLQLTPAHVPYLSKTAALIIEKGGMLSHAAIVSRELGIPCIINVKNVLNEIKDGAKVKLKTNGLDAIITIED